MKTVTLRRLALILLVSFSFFVLESNYLMAEPMYISSTEEQFRDLFITAGYSTAFGAALGAAFLGLSNKQPGAGANSRYLTYGASLGFITGSALGLYMAISPHFALDVAPVNPLEPANSGVYARLTTRF